jgi:hypothetical protein
VVELQCGSKARRHVVRNTVDLGIGFALASATGGHGHCNVPSRYSTIDEGQCIGDDATTSASCSWYSTFVKRVSKRCHDASMANYILTRSTHMREGLANCPVPPGTSEADAIVWPFVRPTSILPADPCWIRSFFAVLLGPDADHQVVRFFCW